MFYFMKEKHLMDQSNEVKCTVARRHWFQHRRGLPRKSSPMLIVSAFYLRVDIRVGSVFLIC